MPCLLCTQYICLHPILQILDFPQVMLCEVSDYWQLAFLYTTYVFYLSCTGQWLNDLISFTGDVIDIPDGRKGFFIYSSEGTSCEHPRDYIYMPWGYSPWISGASTFSVTQALLLCLVSVIFSQIYLDVHSNDLWFFCVCNLIFCHLRVFVDAHNMCFSVIENVSLH